MGKNTLFEALYYYKDQGYEYVNSNDCECHTGYDQAVADFYEGCGDHIPGYLDWLKESIAPNYEIDDFVFYHEGKLFYGSISKSDYDYDAYPEDVDDTEILERIGSIEKMIEGDIDYPGMYAIAIWNFGLEKETDRIMNLAEYTKGYQSKDFGLSIDYADLYSLLFVDRKCWSDTEFVLGLSKLISGYKTETLKYFCIAIDPTLKTVEFVTEILKNNSKMTAFFPAELNVNRKVALDSIIEDASNFNSISKKLSEDSDFIKEAWNSNHKIYPFLPEAMKADYDIALASLEKDGSFFTLLPDALKTDKLLVKIAMKKSGFYGSKEIFNSLPENMRRDEIFIREMMNDSIDCYEFLDEDLRNNIELLKLGLNIKYSSCYQHIPQALREAIKKDIPTLKQVLQMGVSFDTFYKKREIGGTGECSDRELMIQLLDLGISIGTYNITKEFHTDEALLLKLVKNDGGEIRNISETLQNKEEFILAAISSWRYYYEKLTPKHRKNKKIAVFAINKYKEESPQWGVKEISKSIPKAILDDAEIQELLTPSL
ncbi:MAG: DUF4116 domain-containing protein [Bacteroidota bacterium]